MRLVLFLCITFACLLSGIAYIALMLCIESTDIRYTVESSSLTHFDVDCDRNVLDISLVANISIRNPSSRVSVHYPRLESVTSYAGVQLCGPVTLLEQFYLGHKSTFTVTAAYRCRCSYDGRFRKDAASVDVNVWLRHSASLKLGSISTSSRNTMKCALDLRLVANESMNSQVTGTPCDAFLYNTRYHASDDIDF